MEIHHLSLKNSEKRLFYRQVIPLKEISNRVNSQWNKPNGKYKPLTDIKH